MVRPGMPVSAAARISSMDGCGLIAARTVGRNSLRSRRTAFAGPARGRCSGCRWRGRVVPVCVSRLRG